MYLSCALHLFSFISTNPNLLGGERKECKNVPSKSTVDGDKFALKRFSEPPDGFIGPNGDYIFTVPRVFERYWTSVVCENLFGLGVTRPLRAWERAV